MGSVDPAGDYSRFFHTFMNVHPAVAASAGAHHHLGPTGALHHHPRWRFFPVPTRSFWTKYCLLCTVCGSAATILAGIFLVVAALFRYYTTSIYYFETVPTYIPAILLSICGVSTIAFSCKRNRNIILLRITACWSLVSAALSSVITITTSLIHMNRLQTLRECVYNGKPNPPSCTCIAHTLNIDSIGHGYEPVHYVFENTPDCDVIHGTLYSCLRAVFAISVVAVLLSIFLCMLLYQLIGHERKKAYWSRIRRINSDWSADFIACLARPMPRERSSMMPLVMSPTAVSLPMSMSNGTGPMMPPPPPQGIYGWEPPPPYEGLCQGNQELLLAANNNHHHPTATSVTPAGPPPTFGPIPPTSNRLSSISNNNFNKPPDSYVDTAFPIINANSFSPTITSMEPQLNHQPADNNHHQRGYDAGATAGRTSSSVPDNVLPSTHSLKNGTQTSSDNNTSKVEHFTTPGSYTPLKRRNKAINSLPNSPILMNVRRFCSFSSADNGRGKKSVSIAKLNQDGRGDECSSLGNRHYHQQQRSAGFCNNPENSQQLSDCSEDEELARF